MKKQSELKKQLEYYMKLPYNMYVKYREEQGGYYVAGYTELPDLAMTGNTPEEAVRALLSEKTEWFELNIKHGYKIPLPHHPHKYSGKINFRMPRHMHETIAAIAENEGVSINQYLLSAVAQAAGIDKTKILEKSKAHQ